MNEIEQLEAVLNQMTTDFIEDVKIKTGIELTMKIINNNSALLKIHEFRKNQEPILTLNVIENVVLENYPITITPEQFKSKDRRREFVDTRAIFSHIARKYKYSYSQIAKYMGRDHTSIIHLVRKTDDLLDVDVVFKDVYFNIINKIKTDAQPV